MTIILLHATKTTTPVYTAQHVIIGGGVIGLALAARLCRESRKQGLDMGTLVLEKNGHIGAETSSRNSEVIHSGIYYAEESLKTQLCNVGADLMYRYCHRRNVPCRRVGKYIVGSTESDEKYLYQMKERTDRILKPSDRLFFVSKDQMEREEPFVKAKFALCSPRTGILDSHSYMQALKDDIEKQHGLIMCHSKVNSIEYSASQSASNQYRIHLVDSIVQAPFVFNCAGLYCEHVARMLWRNKNTVSFPSQYRIYYYKGQYFAYRPSSSSSSRIKIQHLIYPIPDVALKSLGIHATIDMNNRIKFGPDAHFIRPAFSDEEIEQLTDKMLSREEIFDYKVDQKYAKPFHAAIGTYLKNIELDELNADYAGIRPKLMKPGENKFQDFIIQEESKNGFPGFVNLIGIESPGLTSSLAIANYVAELLNYSPKHHFQ
jgi:2-hydroxyglutarate dehydrogenase